MFEVNIYISTRIKGVRATTGYWAYVLETVLNGETKTVEGIGEETQATNNILNLMALYRAMERMKKPSSIKVYADCGYLAGPINNNWLDAWEHNGWKNAKDTPVKNADIWGAIWQQSMEHDVYVEVVETHPYKSWQQEQLKKYEKECKNVDFTQ